MSSCATCQCATLRYRRYPANARSKIQLANQGLIRFQAADPTRTREKVAGDVAGGDRKVHAPRSIRADSRFQFAAASAGPTGRVRISGGASIRSRLGSGSARSQREVALRGSMGGPSVLK